MPIPEFKPARLWDIKRRVDAAVDEWLADQSQTQISRYRKYGIDGKTFRSHLTKERERRDLLQISLGLQADFAADDEQYGPTDDVETEVAKWLAANGGSALEDADPDREGERAYNGAGRHMLVPMFNERRRLPTGDEFDRIYFDGLSDCPDCNEHHDSPAFHSEMRTIMNDPDVQRAGFNLPPYHAKSTVVTIRNTVERVTHDPNYRRIIVSKSIDFARTLMVGIQDLLTNRELYAKCQRNLVDDWGPFKTGEKGERWNQSLMYVAGRTSAQKDPTVIVLGVGGQIYGRRADDIVFDDIATVANQSNPENVAKMLEWTDKEALSRIGKRGKAAWVGTRVHGGDVYSYLAKRMGYTWLRYPLILNEEQQLTLWPEHFPFSQALMHRAEMSARDFALVYMNHELPGMGASFTEENVVPCFDFDRPLGHFDNKWVLIAGLDPAGGGAGGGVTSAMLYGIDLTTGFRYIVDHQAVQGMRAPELKALMLDWSHRYPIYEWRVESNSVQSNLVQFNEDITRPLHAMGVRVTAHVTTSNKWDPQIGVESLAPLFSSRLVSIPWANAPTRVVMQPLVEELYTFPIGARQDRVMSLWFAELGARDRMRRASMPLFDQHTERWPNRIKRQRVIANFAEGEVTRIPLGQQSPYRTINSRRVVGRPTGHNVPLPEPAPSTPLVNVGGTVEGHRNAQR